MTTVTGNILDPSGTAVVGATVKFLAQSTPLDAGSGNIVISGPISITTATGGAFSQALEAGNYTVQIINNSVISSITIAVPSGSSTVAMDTLITSGASSYIYQPGGANFRVAAAGIQIYNNDTGLWHTLTVAGNPPQLGIDGGNS